MGRKSKEKLKVDTCACAGGDHDVVCYRSFERVLYYKCPIDGHEYINVEPTTPTQVTHQNLLAQLYQSYRVALDKARQERNIIYRVR